MGKITIFMAIFHIAMFVYQRVDGWYPTMDQSSWIEATSAPDRSPKMCPDRGFIRSQWTAESPCSLWNMRSGAKKRPYGFTNTYGHLSMIYYNYKHLSLSLYIYIYIYIYICNLLEYDRICSYEMLIEPLQVYVGGGIKMLEGHHPGR